MQQVLNEPKLKLKRATETQLSHKSALDALWQSLKAVKATLGDEVMG